MPGEELTESAPTPVDATSDATTPNVEPAANNQVVETNSNQENSTTQEATEPKPRGRKPGSTVISPEQKEREERRWGELKNENKSLRDQVLNLNKMLDEAKANTKREEDTETIKSLQEEIARYKRAFDFENSEEYRGVQGEIYDSLSILREDLGIPMEDIEEIVSKQSAVRRSVAISNYAAKLKEQGKSDAEVDVVRHTLSDVIPNLVSLTDKISKMKEDAESGKKAFYDSRVKQIVSRRALNDKFGFELLSEEDEEDPLSAVGKKYKELEEKYNALLQEKEKLAYEDKKKDEEVKDAKKEASKAKAVLQSESVKRRNAKPTLSGRSSASPKNERRGIESMMSFSDWMRTQNKSNTSL